MPTFKVGKRNRATTTAFVQDVASRLRNRVQISTDALHGYVEAIEQSFGAEVDYGQIVKVYTHDSDDKKHPKRHVTVLHIPPVVSPETAVKAAIVQQYMEGN